MNRKKMYALIVIVILSLPTTFSLLSPGFFQTDDGEWMIIRFSAFHQALREGQFPVRFLPRLNYGYGYPVANFLYPGFMYLAEPIKVMGFGFVDTIKIVIGLSLISSSIFTFLWLSKIFSKTASVFGALIYLYAPYHLYDTYTRGSVGEVLALAVAPFIVWNIERKSLFWTSLGIGLLILSHNTLAVLFLSVIGGYVLVKYKKTLKFYIGSFLLGIGISTFFWFPALYDLQYTVFSSTKISHPFDHFASVSLMGFPILLLLFVSVFQVVVRYNSVKNNQNFPLVLYFFVIALVALILSSSVSSLFWRVFPISFIQFPFRILSLELVSMAFISSFFLHLIQKKVQLITAIAISGVIFISSYQYLFPKAFFDKGDGFYSTNEDTTTVKNEYMPKWVKNIPLVRPKDVVEAEYGLISDLTFKSGFFRFSFQPNHEANSFLTINKVYFPGWVAEVNNNKIPVFPTQNGLIGIHISGVKRSDIQLFFSETTERTIGNIISVISFLLLVTISIYNTKILKKYIR